MWLACGVRMRCVPHCTLHNALHTASSFSPSLLPFTLPHQNDDPSCCHNPWQLAHSPSSLLTLLHSNPLSHDHHSHGCIGAAAPCSYVRCPLAPPPSRPQGPSFLITALLTLSELTPWCLFPPPPLPAATGTAPPSPPPSPTSSSRATTYEASATGPTGSARWGGREGGVRQYPSGSTLVPY